MHHPVEVNIYFTNFGKYVLTIESTSEIQKKSKSLSRFCESLHSRRRGKSCFLEVAIGPYQGSNILGRNQPSRRCVETI